MKDEFNPFPVTGYFGAEFFCDREKELAQLSDHFNRRLHTTIFAIRRLGKSALIWHYFQKSEKARRATIYIDILSTTTLNDFLNVLATAIYARFPEQKPAGKRFMELLKSLRPVISYDTLTGEPQVSLDLSTPKALQKSVEQLLTFLDSHNTPVIIAIDEFQQILEYPETNTEAILRTAIQRLKNVRFIFSGSNQKMMNEIFNDAKRPFFASCSSLNLGYIPQDKYRQFIKKAFNSHKRKISDEAIDFIMDFTLGHTYYVQYLCNQIFAGTQKVADIAEARKAALDILAVNEPSYFLYRNLITAGQWQTLRAIAMETRVYRPHSTEFMLRYRLGSSSIVTRTLEALLHKELIFRYHGEGEPYYEVYDKFLMRWLQRL